MKALGWLKPQRYPKKPSRVLGFLLAVVFVILVIFASWEVTHRLFWFDVEPVGLQSTQWIVLLGAVAAVTGWIVSAMVTIRNSIKQHTISTLLQSRLSSTYMDNAKPLNARYFGPNNCIHLLTEDELTSKAPEAKLPELSFLLNYLEFIAAAIKYGDLDEKLMRMTFRGMVCNMYEAASVYIASNQKPNVDADGKVTPSKSFEHLTWLYNLWLDESLRRHSAPRPAATPPPPAA